MDRFTESEHDFFKILILRPVDSAPNNKTLKNVTTDRDVGQDSVDLFFTKTTKSKRTVFRNLKATDIMGVFDL